MKFEAAAVRHPHFPEIVYSGPNHAEAAYDAESEWGTDVYDRWFRGYINDRGEFVFEADVQRMIADPWADSFDVIGRTA